MTRRTIVRAFVRGEAERSDLASIGVSIACADTGCTIEEPDGIPIVVPTIGDVATGLVANWARSTDLRDWARVILAANFIDLSSLEDRPEGERLLEVLWDASAGAALSDAVLELLRVLVAEPRDFGDG